MFPTESEEAPTRCEIALRTGIRAVRRPAGADRCQSAFNIDPPVNGGAKMYCCGGVKMYHWHGSSLSP